jgi:formylglycine-generating enzyme required for sulfatase activity
MPWKNSFFVYICLAFAGFALLVVSAGGACSEGDDDVAIPSFDDEDDDDDDFDGSDDDSVSDDDDSVPDDDDDTTADDDDDDSGNPSTPSCNSGECFIKAAEFQMGCEPDDNDNCSSDEYPRHSVRLSSYYIDQFEVSNSDYASYLTTFNADNDCDGSPCILNPHDVELLGIDQDGLTWAADAGWEEKPVIFVSWKGALAYCQAKGKRLPTEAEWEMAAKGGQEHYAFPWGDTWYATAANHSASGDPFESSETPPTSPKNYFDGSSHSGYQTHDGTSPWGIIDMAGNVAEWVSDWYGELYYSDVPTGGWENPEGPSSGTQRTLRGGSFEDTRDALRNSGRGKGNPVNYLQSVGFRCAK